MLYFLSWILPWVWLSLGALSGLLYWRGSKGALPLMWCFLALGVGDLVGTWMAERSIHNLWLDRALALGVTGGFLTYIDNPPVPKWLILIGTFVASCFLSGASSFGLLTPIVILGLVGSACWLNLQRRLQGATKGGIHWLVGNAGWAWISVVKVFADYVLKMSPGMFLIYWSFIVFGSILVAALMLGGVYASDNVD